MSRRTPEADPARDVTPGRRARRLALLLALTSSLLLLGGYQLRDRELTPDSTAAGWQRCLGVSDCILDAVTEELERRGPERTLQSALTVFASAPNTPPGCHGVTHYIGQAIAATGEPAPQLGALWSTCGYGTLHGVYETLPLPTDPEQAGRNAYERCRGNKEVYAERDLMSRCTHALGHSIYTAMNADMVRAVQACRVDPDQVAVQQCLGGVYMMDRNARWPDGDGPDDTAAWQAALPHCLDPAGAATCVLAYAEVATSTSEQSTLSWLDLCFAATAGAAGTTPQQRCLLFTGQGAAFDHMAQGPGPDIRTCLEYAADHAPDLADACLAGIENALDAVGTPEKSRRTLTCEILAPSTRRCS